MPDEIVELPPGVLPNGAVRTDLEAIYDIPVTVSAVLGKATMQVSQLLKLGRGAVVELDRKLGKRSTSTSITGWSPAARWSWWMITAWV